MSASETKHMFYTNPIVDEDILLVFSTPDEMLSRREIAERVWRKVTPDFIRRIERMVNEGALEKYGDWLPNGKQMFWYKKAVS